MTGKKININNHSIYYRVTGQGKPVLFIHGFGEEGTIWDNQIEYLKNKLGKGYQFIVPDLPGSGQSRMIDDMSIEGIAEIIRIILDAEIFSSPPGRPGGASILIGHSMGGYITLAFAAKYPEYLDAFGLFHSTAFADTEEKKTIRRKGIEFIKQEGAFGFLETTSPNLFSPHTRANSPNLVETFISSLDHFSNDALIGYYESMMQRPDRISVLKEARVPVLFVMGESDTAIPLQDGLKQCHLPGKSYIHILHQSAHMGMLEEADKSNRLLEEFLLKP